nr:hypothetical protein [Herpetosiphonaceae bacterium]
MLRFQRRTGFWAGLLVGAALTGLLYLGSRLKLTAFVPLDIANAIIEFTPGDIATATIENLGKWGMRSLIIASVLGFVLAYAILGMLLATWLQRRPDRPNALLPGAISAIFPLVLTLILERAIPANRAIANLDSGAILLLALVYGLGGMALGWLTAGLIRRTTPGAVSDTSRRRFLLGSVGAALALAAGSAGVAALIPRRSVEQAGVALPTAVPAPPTIVPTSPAVATVAAGAPTPT